MRRNTLPTLWEFHHELFRSGLVCILFDCKIILDTFGTFANSFHSLIELFNQEGVVMKVQVRNTRSRWPPIVNEYVRDYVKEHPCFLMEELRDILRASFPTLTNTSLPTICRALRHDLGLTRKVLQKRAREAGPQELVDYQQRLQVFYNYPEQLVFIDESSKDGRAALRRYAWSKKGEPAIVILPFSRGKRVSLLAAMDKNGFQGWSTTSGTFTRTSFHQAFLQNILPLLNPYPLPNSIVIMDNARIHMYSQLEEAIATRGALLFYLPPYSPQLNSIEVGFSQLKRWLERYDNLIFPHQPENVLDVALPACTKGETTSVNLFSHCGYEQKGVLRDEMFKQKEKK